MKDEQKITLNEFRELFGDDIPSEAFELVWTAPAGMTVSEVRARLREMAGAKSAAMKDEQIAREPGQLAYEVAHGKADVQPFSALPGMEQTVWRDLENALWRAGFDACKEQAATTLELILSDLPGPADRSQDAAVVAIRALEPKT